MKPITAIKQSFAGGEFAPSLYSRTDLQKYSIGLRKAQNMIVHPHGGISNRAGLEYIDTCKETGKKARVVPFEFSTSQTYVLELGDYYARFYADGEQVYSDSSYDVYTKLMMHCNTSPFSDEIDKTILNQNLYTKLLLHLNGPDGAMAFRDTGNTNHSANISTNGTVTKSTAQKKFSDASCYLGGTDTYIEISDNADWNFDTNDFVIDCWIRWDGTVADSGIVGQKDASNYGWKFHFEENKLKIQQYESGGGNTVLLEFAWTPSADTWYHIALVKSSNDYSAYVNGSQIGTTQTDADDIADFAGVLRIGQQPTLGGPSWSDSFKGWLADFRITVGTDLGWTGASITIPTDTPTADANTKLLLSFDPYDNATTPHIATFYNNAQIDTAEKKFGTAALLLDGTGDYISFPHHADWNFGTGNFTIDLQTNLAADEDSHFIGQYEDANNYWYFRYDAGNSKLHFYYKYDSTALADYEVAWTPTADGSTWYHLALVRDESTVYIFIDGVSQTLTETVAIGTSDLEDINAALTIGAQNSSFDLNGWLDEIRVNKEVATWTSNFVAPAEEHAISTVTLDTSDKKFGAGSAAFDGDTYLSVADDADWNFGINNFSVDFQCFFSSLTGAQGLIGQYEDANNYWTIRKNADNTITILFKHEGTTKAYYYTTSAYSFSVDTWYHVEVTRSGANLYLFINGVSQALTTDTSFGSSSTGDISGYLYMGYDPSSSSFLTGNMDEIRVSKGVARHTAGFTAPTSEYTTGAIYEIETPYSEDDIADIQFTQSADVLYLAHPDYAPRQLERLGNTDWELNLYDFVDGPFQVQNTDTSKTIAASAVTGDDITLTASGFTFNSLHVGALYKLRHYIEGQALTESITGTGATSSISCGGTWRLITHGTWSMTMRIEKSTDGGSTWTMLREFSSVDDFNANTYGTEDLVNNEPFLIRLNCTADTSGTCNANLTADPWYQEGNVKITAVAAGGTTATADVKRDFGSTDVTVDWAEGSWSDYRGWPAVVEFHPEDRLMWANTYYEPQTYWLTRSGNYTSFYSTSPLIDSYAISSPLPSRKVNGINGLIPLKEMVALTLSNEVSISSTSGVLAHDTLKNSINGWEGSYGVRPVVIGNRAIYVQSTGSIVRDLGYNLMSESFEGEDLTKYSNHLFLGYTISEMTFQQNPDRILWAVRSDGKLLSMTYMREEEFVAWTWHQTNDGDDLFESVCSIRGSGHDEVWFVVNRNGTRYIERMTQRMTSTDLEDQFFVDCGYEYDDVATATIDGLDHLEGKDVVALADGVVVKGLTVSGGEITLDTAASHVIVGLQYIAEIETLGVDVGLEDGTSQGRQIKISQVILRLLNSAGGQIGQTSSLLRDIVHQRRHDYDADTLFSGDQPETLGGGFSRDGRFIIRQSDPLPITISAIIPQITIAKGMTQAS